jgi:hypothetical protein
MRHWVDIDGNAVLQALLDNSGLTWTELCRELGFEPDASHPGPMALFNCLRTLFEADLIAVDGVLNRRYESFLLKVLRGGTSRRKIRASDRWRQIEMALAMKYLGAGRPSTAAMTVYPQFGHPGTMKTDVFAVMPFAADFDPVYLRCIKAASDSLDLTVRRGDDVFSGNGIVADVWGGICGAGAVVADCTGRNPNVFYEIGMAHTVGRPVVLITRDDDDVPVDLKHLKYIRYQRDEAGLETLRTTLEEAFSNVLGLY